MNPITTSFGEIRPWRRADAADLARYANNRTIWINLRDGFPHPYTLQHAHAFLDGVSQQHPVTVCAIATRQETIGGIGITPGQDVHRLTAELGYWLAEPYWGRGWMTETVIAFTDDAFARLGLVRIYAEPYAWNAPSCRVLEKAGFLLEARLRASAVKDGQIIDQLLYAKVRI